ncbi:MAG: NADP-dependent malic enzyme [Candidatus Izimaplasma sp.]|nr:NADP-dependent malic enzyme [Candidatus Izimaplasma bacterium]
MKNMKHKSLMLHKKHPGKLEVISTIELTTPEDLSLAYSPYVAEPSKAIHQNIKDVYNYTSKGNMVAVISDGSAVLGLGNIGPEAALPVMEGKAVLFKTFANIDAFPIVLDTQDPKTIIDTITHIAPGFGGINLEDISAPNCIIIERALKEILDIPVFHDDQHGTSIVTLAGLINACRLTNRKLEDLEIVISGLGAAGGNIARLLHKMGIRHIYGYSLEGVTSYQHYQTYDFSVQELLDDNIVLSSNLKTLPELIKNKDVFIGVSAKNIVDKNMIQTMHQNPFIFAMANPDPEISYPEAKQAGAKVVGTGRSDYPNQINNVLAFPGLFKGVLKARAKNINDEMKIAAAKAIAAIIKDDELHDDYIIPSPFDKRVAEAVSNAVYEQAKRDASK